MRDGEFAISRNSLTQDPFPHITALINFCHLLLKKSLITCYPRKNWEQREWNE